MSSLRCSWVVIFSGSTEWIRKGSMIVFGLKTIVDMALSLLLFLSPGSSPRLSSSHFVTTLLSESHLESFLTTTGFGWTQVTISNIMDIIHKKQVIKMKEKSFTQVVFWYLWVSCVSKLENYWKSKKCQNLLTIFIFFLIVNLQLWVVVVLSDFQIALHPIHATLYGNLKCEKKCLCLNQTLIYW